MEKANCSNVENHTVEPSGYLNWHGWAENMAKTHRQTKCPDCGFYVIWNKLTK